MWKNLTFLGLVLLLSLSCLPNHSEAASEVDSISSTTSGKVPAENSPADLSADVAMGSTMLGHMSKKFAEELIATPMQQGWKDIYHQLVHVNGSKFLRYLQFLTGSRQTKSLTSFLMKKISKEVFDGHTNRDMWGRLEKELYFIVSNWWANSPEDPEHTLENGIWHSLVLFYKNFLSQTMKGSERLQKMNAILFDPKLEVIGSWAEEWSSENSQSFAEEKNSSENEDVETAESD